MSAVERPTSRERRARNGASSVGRVLTWGYRQPPFSTNVLTAQKSRDIIARAVAANLSGEKGVPAKAAVRAYHSADALKHQFILVASSDHFEPMLLSVRRVSVATPRVSLTKRTCATSFIGGLTR